MKNETVGYYASKDFQLSEMQNTIEGNITISNRNGVVTVYVRNLQCTENKPILEISGYVGVNYYLYDTDITGLYIDKSLLYSSKPNIKYAVLCFCL